MYVHTIVYVGFFIAFRYLRSGDFRDIRDDHKRL